jgi:hypothetical protein
MIMSLISDDIKHMERELGEDILRNKEVNYFKILTGNKDLDTNDIPNWYKVGKIIGNFGLNISDASPTRYYNSSVMPTWLEYLTNLVYMSFYTDSVGNSLYGTQTQNTSRIVKDKNQQVFIGFNANADIDPNSDILYPLGIPLVNCAWIKFNYNNFPNEENVGMIKGFIQFQGYRFKDMPPAPVLKAFAHGPPVDMSAHVKKLFPEWTRPDTLRLWLNAVMEKWLADILALKDKLIHEICVDDHPNDEQWHLRDAVTIQMDLYNDVERYINSISGVRSTFEILGKQANTMDPNLLYTKVKEFGNTYKAMLPASKLQKITPRSSQTKEEYRTQLKGQIANLIAPLKGGRRKTATKSKGMTHRSKHTRKAQRGGAAMPLAYFQDGAQMRGTYADPTGVGLASSTDTMARTGISQTGGRRCQNGGKQSGRRQNGGFAPSIMGQMVVNGSYLTPVASYMGYRLMKNSRSRKGSRSAHHSGNRFTSRGPRSTQKKRRVTHRR